MNERSMVRRGAAAAVGLMIGGLLLAPAAPASPALADTTTPAASVCTVSSADFAWGLKKSFRDYISGSIANGEWTTENGASYETPHFMWSDGSGALEPSLESGSVAFTGDVHFTGHGGVMQLDIADPEIEFTDDGNARLVLQVGSTDVEGAETVYERVDVAKIALAGRTSADGDTLTITEAPVWLTSEGAEALNGAYGTYVSGEEVDPITLSVVTTDCALTAAAVPTEKPIEEAPADVNTDAAMTAPVAPEQAPEIPWLPIGIGAVALIVIGVTVGMLVAGGRKGDTATSTEE